MKLNKKQNGIGIIFTGILYVALLSMLFSLVEFGQGNAATWYVGIILGALSIMLLGFNLNTFWKENKYKKFSLLLISWWANVIMVIASIIDIVGNNNHGLTTVMFVVIPLVTISSLTITLE